MNMERQELFPERGDSLEHPPYVRPLVNTFDDTALFDLLGPARTLYACDPTQPGCP